MQAKNIKLTSANSFLLPPRGELCQECATKHDDNFPHDATSLFYQTKFNMDNGRAATWHDAMAHCDEQMKADWIEALKAEGVKV